MYKVIVMNKKSPTSFGRNDKMKTVKYTCIYQKPFQFIYLFVLQSFSTVNQIFKLKLTYTL